jgi:hypothetical protein
MTSAELALLDRSQNAREHPVRLCAVFGSVAPTDLARDDSRAQGVLGAPVGGVDRVRLREKRKNGREFDGQMRGEAARDASGTGPVDEGVESVLQMAVGNGDTVGRHARTVIAIAEPKRLLQEMLDAWSEGGSR